MSVEESEGGGGGGGGSELRGESEGGGSEVQITHYVTHYVGY